MTAKPSISGMVGVGTWSTQAEFKDIKVVKDGQTLFESDFSDGMSGWTTVRGQWEVVDGALRQIGDGQDTRALVGDPTWSDYKLTLKARKLSGNEGFLIHFGVPGATESVRSWWNLGGWGNTEHALDTPDIKSAHVSGQIETGRWYEITIDLTGESVRAYLDGRLLHSEAKPLDVPPFEVRPGYRVELVAKNIGEVRFIEFGERGTLYVSQPRRGAIITLQKDRNGNWSKVADFVTGKRAAHGMHYYDGWLWYSHAGAISKARDTNGDGVADEDQVVVFDLPRGGAHWWRSILVTQDALYTSIGDSGNATDELDSDRQKIWKFNLDGTGKTLFASGLRNTEKLRLRPGTNEVWGADHGSDYWGRPLQVEGNGRQPFTDHFPPDEFNHYIEGAFYGHPFVLGAGLPRLEYKDRPDFLDLAETTIHPEWSFGAHWATNGWNFLESEAMLMQGDAIVACHGSWNSSKRVGYRLERLMFDPVTDVIYGSQTLVSTITDNQVVLGRPCDVAEAPDGSIFFSDDFTGRVYRLTVGVMPKSKSSAPTGVVSSNVPDPFRPIYLFQSICAKCHGSYGEGYGGQFKGKLNDAALSERLDTMLAGPAQLQLNGSQKESLLQFLRSLRDDKPFGYIVAVGDDGTIVGEATPGANIVLRTPVGDQSIPLNGHSWIVKLPDGTDWAQAQVLIRANGGTVEIPLTERVGR